MADHLTEEEQIEAIKRWWNDNWLSIVVPIVIAVLAYTGWNYWSDHKEATSASASEEYQVLTEFLQEAGNELSEEQRNEALTLAEELRTDYAGSLYADLSAMIVAKLYVDSDKIVEAESALRSVVDDPASVSIQEVARARLAKTLLEQDKHSEALALVSKTDSESMKALYAETRGDIYLDQGETAAAHTAYKEALDSLAPSQFAHRGIVQFKLDGTKSSARSAAVAAESTADLEPQEELVVETADEASAQDAPEEAVSDDQE